MSSPVSPARFVLRVPATSANLGAGFDCLGLALTLHDTVRIATKSTPGVRIEISGEGADSLPRDEKHLIVSVLKEMAQRIGFALPGLHIRCTNRIPQCRGLGSSAAAVVAGVAAAHLLGGATQIERATLLHDAATFEGHPDNVAAAVFGGLTIAWQSPEVSAVRLAPHGDVSAIVAIPAAHSSTARSRRQLPESVPFTDAVFNIAHASMAVAALTTSPEILAEALADRLHEPYRRRSWPASWSLVTRLRKAGLAAAISGAGSTVIVLHRKQDAARTLREVRAAVAGQFQVKGIAVDRFGLSATTASGADLI